MNAAAKPLPGSRARATTNATVASIGPSGGLAPRHDLAQALASIVASRWAHAQVVHAHEVADALRRQMAQATALVAFAPPWRPLAESVHESAASFIDAWLASVNAYGRACVSRAVTPPGRADASR